MRRFILLLTLAAFADAGVIKFTTKHIVRPVLVHGVWHPLKHVKRVVW